MLRYPILQKNFQIQAYKRLGYTSYTYINSINHYILKQGKISKIN